MPFKVKVTVINQEGKCIAGHKVGQEFIFDGPKMPSEFCPDALCCFYPRIFAAAFGAKFPWVVDRFRCPDPNNPVVFEVKVMGLSTWSFYYKPEMKLVEIARKKPGIEVKRLREEFTEKERKYYELSTETLRVFLRELEEVKYIELRDNRVYPIKQKLK